MDTTHHQNMNAHIFRLQPADIIKFAGEPCRVVRVSESAAVIAIRRPARSFTTLAGKPVSFQPKPRTAYISPNSEVEIIHRPTSELRSQTTVREANRPAWGTHLVAGLG